MHTEDLNQIAATVACAERCLQAAQRAQIKDHDWRALEFLERMADYLEEAQGQIHAIVSAPTDGDAGGVQP